MFCDGGVGEDIHGILRLLMLLVLGILEHFFSPSKCRLLSVIDFWGNNFQVIFLNGSVGIHLLLQEPRARCGRRQAKCSSHVLIFS